VNKSTKVKNNERLLQNRLPNIKQAAIFFSITIGGIILDLWSKSAIFARLDNGETLPIIDGIVQFIRTTNPGAAFGIAHGQRTLLVSVSVIALLVILGIFFFGKIRDISMTVILALLAAGVTGNLYDRIFNHGQVRDFIDVVYWPGRHWPAFNVADSLLCIAVGLLIITGHLFTPRSGQKHDRQQK
jgi:signal peptidase II